MTTKTTPEKTMDVWALLYSDGQWYPCDHMLLDPKVMANSQNARPFYGDPGKHDANLFAKLRPGSQVVPHPHAEKWRS